MKTKEVIILLLILIFVIGAVIIPKPINSLDELWNFNFARNIANGKLPYKDFNMVQAPLFSIIAGLILKLLGTELLVMRILGILLATSIMLIIFFILRECNISNNYLYLVLIFIFLLFKNFFGFDYNFINLFIILLTIYIEIKNIDKLDYKNEFLLGILVGTSIMVKQSTGLVFSLIFIFYRILNIYEKAEWKQEFKRIAARTAGVLVSILVFCLYLIVNNIWYEFIDYAILGIKTFSNSISYINLINGNYGIIMQLLSIIMPVSLLYIYAKTIVIRIKTREDKILFIFFAYSVASLSAIYPISDNLHFLIGILPLRASINLYNI